MSTLAFGVEPTLSRTQFEGKRIVIFGLARTGLAAAPVLRELGAEVVLADSASESQLGARADEARATGAEVFLSATPDLLQRAVDIVVTSPGVPSDSPILRQAVRLGIPVFSEIEVAYRISAAPILAVTGTNGKTTTAMMLADMLRASGRRTWLAGNISADDVKQPLITAAHRAENLDAIVAEISSFQLEWIEEFCPAVGVLTNLTPDHLNRHASFREYAACKARMFSAQTEEDVAVVNAVNAPARAIGERLRSRLLWFDRGHCLRPDSACVREGYLTVRWDGEEFKLCKASQLRVPGTHNVENALAAAAAAIAFGARPEPVSQALREFRGVVHRMEFVGVIEGISYINNSMCTNVDAAIRSLEAAGAGTVLIAGGVSKATDFAPLGAAIARYAGALVLIGQAAGEIEEAARACGFSAVHRAESMEEAVARASSLAPRGGRVMLSPACASFDMFADFEARGEAFRRAVRELGKRS